MADLIETIGNLAVGYAEAKGATAYVRLNAWPWEIPVGRLADADASPGLIKGQVIVRNSAGSTLAKVGPDVDTNWLLSAAVAGGLGLLFFVIVRGLAARK